MAGHSLGECMVKVNQSHVELHTLADHSQVRELTYVGKAYIWLLCLAGQTYSGGRSHQLREFSGFRCLKRSVSLLESSLQGGSDVVWPAKNAPADGWPASGCIMGGVAKPGIPSRPLKPVVAAIWLFLSFGL
uniref:Uncharacterized protein n=1 Tax=Cannabis sativa TaxID=3483 RepID=A0A803Q0A4_CANSA